MTSKGLGEVFKGDSADRSAGKFPLVGGRANGQACVGVDKTHKPKIAEEDNRETKQFLKMVMMALS